VLVMAGLLLYARSAGAFPDRAVETASTSTGTLAYQGRLTNPGGTPLTGSYSMTFKLYNVASGGSALWMETWSGGNTVQVTDGLFNVLLGSLTPVPQSVITGNNTLWLGVKVGADAEMTPRAQVGSVPFAVQALTIPDGSVTTAKLSANAVTQLQSVSGTSASSTNSTTFVDVPGRSVTLTTTGGAVLAMSSASFHMSPAGFTGYWQIIRDGSVVIAHNNYGFSTVDWTTITVVGVDTPPAGTHTYKVQWRVNSASGTLTTSEGVYTENFVAVELKR